jgi:hypothetical protein
MSLFDRVLRTAIDTTARGIALATEVSGIAMRGAVGAISPEVAEQLRRALAEPLNALFEIPGAVHQTTGLPIPQQALDTANVFRALVAPDVEDATDGELVRRRNDDPGMPAFLEIVTQLTPDEARILRHLADTGPAPVMDLEAVSLVGRGTRLLLAHQTMAAERAGCATPAQVDAYLANLVRLGILEYRDEELEGHHDYQLIVGTEPYRAAARRYREDRLWRARGRRGSIHFTTFGVQFVTTGLGRPPAQPGPTQTGTSARSRPSEAGAAEA